MVFAGALTKPFHFLVDAIVGERYSHNGSLRGMSKECAHDRNAFTAHFVAVAKSTGEEAGWFPYVNKRESWMKFLECSGAVVERRCSEGHGAIDETRAVFVVQWNLDRVKKWLVNDSRDLRHDEVESREIMGERSSAERQVIYIAKKMRGSFSDRDYLVERFKTALDDGSYCIVCRSLAHWARNLNDKQLHSMKESRMKKRVRATVKYEGWLLNQVDGGMATRVTYVENVDPGGFFRGVIVNKVLPKMLRDKIDDLLAELDQVSQHSGESAIGVLVN